MGHDDDERPWSVTEGMTDGPGKIDRTADEEKVNVVVAKGMDAQQAS